jgi:nicotinate-nucleotide adenylyltransferase
MAPLAERIAGAAAVANHPRLRVTAIEVRLGTRFTADTLRSLVRRFPACRFVWLMGADNLLQIPRWGRWPRIFETVPVAVFDRSPYALKALAGKAASRFGHWRSPPRRFRIAVEAPSWTFLHARRHPASATAIRIGPVPVDRQR